MTVKDKPVQMPLHLQQLLGCGIFPSTVMEAGNQCLLWNNPFIHFEYLSLVLTDSQERSIGGTSKLGE